MGRDLFEGDNALTALSHILESMLKETCMRDQILIIDALDECGTGLDFLLGIAGFTYLGAITPWTTFHGPDETGVSIGRLFLLGEHLGCINQWPHGKAC